MLKRVLFGGVLSAAYVPRGIEDKTEEENFSL